MNTALIDPAKIEKAMDALLRAIVEDEAKRPASAARQPVDIATSAEIDEGDVISEDLDGIIADPVGMACRSEIAERVAGRARRAADRPAPVGLLDAPLPKWIKPSPEAERFDPWRLTVL